MREETGVERFHGERDRNEARGVRALYVKPIGHRVDRYVGRNNGPKLGFVLLTEYEVSTRGD